MKTYQLLKPLPIVRDEESHTSISILKLMNGYAYSTTGVCNKLTEQAKDRILKPMEIIYGSPEEKKCHECLAEQYARQWH